MSLAEPVTLRVRTEQNDVERTKKVLLLGNDDRVLLAVARGLGRQGIKVHVAWCEASSAALKSRYVSAYHTIPAYSAGSSNWLDALNLLAEEQDFDIVIPCNDFAVIPLQKERKRLRRETNWYLLDDHAFYVAFDKAETSRVAQTLEINTPREFSVDVDAIAEMSSAREVSRIEGHELEFPVFVKPRSSVTQSDVTNKRSAQRIETTTELAECLRDCPSDGVLIQESFEGVGIGVEVLASEGKILMQFQHQRLRETIDGGSTYREAVAELPELTDATARLVAALAYTGVAMFEYRHCPRTGNWVFLEINARFWGSLPLAIASGVNFPWGLYELLVLGRSEFSSSYTVGRRCRNLVTDLRAFRKQRGSKLELSRLLLGKEHLDFLAADDWRPQLANLGELAGSLLRKLVNFTLPRESRA